MIFSLQRVALPDTSEFRLFIAAGQQPIFKWLLKVISWLLHNGDVDMNTADLTGISLARANGTALYAQLCTELIAMIENGQLSPGDRLPSERELAAQLNVSRTTVVAAYKELESRGIVRSFIGRGTYVSALPVREGAPFAWRGKVIPEVQTALSHCIRRLLHTDDKVISFAVGVGALELFPHEAFLRATQVVLAQSSARALAYAPAEGLPLLREVLAAREGVHPNEVMIISGAQQGIDLIARCLVRPGCAVVMDMPGYLGAIQSFRFAGANLIGWDVSQADPYELDDLLLRYRPALLYVNPSFQNPTGQVLSLETRQEILRLAGKYRIPVVEDEAYRDLYFTSAPPPTLKSLDREGLVIHLRTFSKSLAPGLRVAYVVADAAIIEQLALVKSQSDLFTAGLTQHALAQLLSEVEIDRHLMRLRRAHMSRFQAMTTALNRYLPPGSLCWQVPSGGIFFWCYSPHYDSAGLLQAATQQGVHFATGDDFYFGSAGRRYLRLCFTGHPPEVIFEGVRRLAGVLIRAAA
jgi:2-aminoadipate transaminase